MNNVLLLLSLIVMPNLAMANQCAKEMTGAAASEAQPSASRSWFNSSTEAGFIWTDALGREHEFTSGAVVEVAYHPTFFTRKRSATALPAMFSGRVIGTRTQAKTGRRFLLVTGSLGFSRTIPGSSIRNMVTSTAEVSPHLGRRLGNAAYAKMTDLGRAVVIATNLVLSYKTFMFSLHASGVGFSWIWNHSVAPVWNQVAAYSQPLAYAGAVGAVYGIHRLTNLEKMRALRVAIRDTNRQFSYLISTACFYWWRPWQIAYYWQTRKVYEKKKTFDQAFKDIEWDAEDQMPSLEKEYVAKEMPEIGPLILADNRGKMPLWLLPGNDPNGRTEFIEKAQIAYQAALDVRRRLLSMGVTQASRMMPILISREPLLGYSSPIEREKTLSGVQALPPELVIAPRLLSSAERRKWATKAKGEGLVLAAQTPDSLSDYATDPVFVARAVAKRVVSRELMELRRDGLLSEALGEYFALSVIAPDTAEVLPGVLFEGYPLRSARSQPDAEGQEPLHLNYNTIAQMDEDIAQSSQVLLRLLWDVRNQFGKDLADELIFDSVQGLDFPAFQSILLGSLANHASTSSDIRIVVVALRKTAAQQELYAYVSRMLELARQNSDHPDLADFVLTRAIKAGLVSDILEALIAPYAAE